MTFQVKLMVDLQALDASLSLLTVAIFAFYYLTVIKPRRQPGPEAKSFELCQHPVQAPPRAPHAPPQNPAPSPTRNSQDAPQLPQVSPKNFIQTQTECLPKTPPRTTVLHGEAAVRALEDFAEDLEKRQGDDSEETHKTSLVKLANVLIGAIQADDNSRIKNARPTGKGQARGREKQRTADPPKKQLCKTGIGRKRNSSKHAMTMASSKNVKKARAHRADKTRKTEKCARTRAGGGGRLLNRTIKKAGGPSPRDLEKLKAQTN